MRVGIEDGTFARAETVGIRIVPLGDAPFAVRWTQASGTTVTNVQDHDRGVVQSFATLPDGRFLRMTGERTITHGAASRHRLVRRGRAGRYPRSTRSRGAPIPDFAGSCRWRRGRRPRPRSRGRRNAPWPLRVRATSRTLRPAGRSPPRSAGTARARRPRDTPRSRPPFECEADHARTTHRARGLISASTGAIRLPSVDFTSAAGWHRAETSRTRSIRAGNRSSCGAGRTRRHWFRSTMTDGDRRP